MSKIFDVVVVGGGMFGSATAYHILEDDPSLSVALVAPIEPTCWDTHTGIFASHYDEGRITRKLDADAIWSQLASSSICRYKKLEDQTGVQFYSELGYLCLGSQDNAYSTQVSKVAKQLSIPHKELNHHAIADLFPCLSVPASCHSNLFQQSDAGCVSPRRYVQAATARAKQLGVQLIDAVVQSVNWDALKAVSLITFEDGSSIEARQCCVSTGAFTDTNLTCGIDLGLRVQGRTVLLKDVTDIISQHPELLELPSLIAEDIEGLPSDLYGLPPLRYPDGRFYMKMGTGDFENGLTSRLEVTTWFRSPPLAVVIEKLENAFKSLVPIVASCPQKTANCALTFTPSSYPVIDFLPNTRILVAVGGNGGGAKSCDEIGRLASLRLLGTWDKSYDIERFATMDLNPNAEKRLGCVKPLFAPDPEQLCP